MLLSLALTSALLAGDPSIPLIIPGTSCEIALPSGWVPAADPGGTALVLIRRDASAKLSLVAGRLLVGEDLEAFNRRCQDDLARLLPGFAAIAPGGVVLGGHPWRRLDYRFGLGQQTIEQRQYIAVVDGIGLVGTCAGRSGTTADAIEDLLGSIGGSRPSLIRR
ncbi:hypothetical protein LBMAG53_27930 [Planctomycetota bacterium]|nr:hypothetical protein LBMAG53_27930 [Planctomycetota bacterium]